jgi:hypothetical protein
MWGNILTHIGMHHTTFDKFDGDQHCYGLLDLDLMVVDVHLNLCGETQ